MAFWLPVGIITVLAIGWAIYPLLKRQKSVQATRASYDKQVFKDQLAEIAADEARGVISANEADRVRTEVSRRLLGAAKEEEAEKQATGAPRGATLTVVAIIAISASLGSLAMYKNWGRPGMPDLPYSANLAQQAAARNDRPSQAEAEALVAAKNKDTSGLPNLQALSQGQDAKLLAQLAEVLKTRPNDLEGHRLLSRNLAAAGRFIEARAAEEDVLRILGKAATPEDHLEHAELMILATEGYVSPEAISELDIVMKNIPENPKARYYAGYALAQYGKPRKAYTLWKQLLQEGPADAPWIPAIKASIGDLAKQAGITDGQAPLAGPSDAQVQAASNMTPAERQDMIRSMVKQLTDRLATDGGSVAEWTRLIGADAVLGDKAATAKAVADAQAAFANDPAALAQINAAAAQATRAAAQAATAAAAPGTPAPAATVAPQAAPALPGPSAQQVQDAASMSNVDRQALIGSMVERLSQRLATQGGSVDEWAKLISVNGVLGDKAAAAKAVADAQAAFANDPAALAQINAAAAALP